MKECPQGHLYPETLDHCPVCEKGLEFQTVFESKPEGTGALEKAAGGHKAANQLAEKLANKSSLNRNQEKTVFLGGDAATKEHFVIGWLIELNNLEIPINSYQLINDETITVGRGQDNHIALKNKTVSRKHCHIEVKNRKIIIHDNNSANGTIVDGNLIKNQQLNENNLVTLGEVNLKIKYLVPDISCQ